MPIGNSDQTNEMVALSEMVNTMSGVGGWEFNLESESLIWTDQVRQIYELSGDYQPTLEEALSFIPTPSRALARETIDNCISDGTSWNLELPLTTAKGREIWVQTMGRATYVGNRISCIVGTLQDISQKKSAQFKLELSEKLARERTSELNVMLANMNQGVSVFDTNGQLAVWNQRYAEIFEKPPEEMVKGTPFKTLLLAEKARGEFSGDVNHAISELNRELRDGSIVKRQFELNSGKIVSSIHVPMPDGGWLGTHEDITSQELASRKIEHAALHDPLTGLANRAKFNQFIEHIAEKSKEEDAVSAVMLIDLDGFKEINDTHGHSTGDELLKEFGRRLSNNVRPQDLVARLGGDEFAIVLDADPSHEPPISRIADRIQAALTKPLKIGTIEISVGASIGAALLDGVESSVESAIRKADCALYKVKEEGKSGFRMFDSIIDLEIAQKRLRERALRNVVRNKDFRLAFQSVHALGDNAQIGFEALLRWDSDQYPEQSPAEFIPMAEEIGLISEIGEWVVEESIATASKWPKATSLSLNVSSRQLGDGIFYDLVERTLKKWDFQSSHLELEITEYAMLQDDQATFRELEKLKKLGVKIVLDDFGTGFSSLSYLHRFPFDKLKIDRSFIRGFEIDDRRANIIRAIIAMSIGLGIEVTAEGIESMDQLALLKMMGCTYAQGFHLGKPKFAQDLSFPAHDEEEQTLFMFGTP